MRIQHNIMAMSAYRNYTNNVSAMKKNLEKLSSGYKINRAGDDAAGLAISEKMRAQITGLETAQKNAKDGISLVQTAEGALTEVHDMLNRMVELATQSANGTYDNDTDRYQLQKEMDQLMSEINRIADSSNFNGIMLLDGSMDAGGDLKYTAGSFQIENTSLHPAGFADNGILLPDVGSVLGTNTVLHTNGTKGGETNAFSIDLENVSLQAGKSMKVSFGDLEIEIVNLDAEGKGKAIDAKDIMSAIADKVNGKSNSNISVNFSGANGTTVTAAGDGTLTIGDTDFSVKATGSRLTFTQTSSDKGIEMPKEVKVDNGSDITITQPDAFDPDTPITATDATGGKAAYLEIDLTGLDVTRAGQIEIKIGGTSYKVTFTDDDIKNADGATVGDGKTLAEIAAKQIAAQMGDKAIFTDSGAGKFTVSDSDGGKITLTADSTDALADDLLKTDGITLEFVDPNVPELKYSVDEEQSKAGAGQSKDVAVTSANLTKDQTGVDMSGIIGANDGKVEFQLGDETYTIVFTAGAGTTGLTQNENEYMIKLASATGNAANDIISEIEKGLKALAEASAKKAAKEATGDDYTIINAGSITVTGGTNTINVKFDIDTMTAPSDGPAKNWSGDYNKSTTVLETKSEGIQDRLASTWFDLEKLADDDGIIAEGTTITIGRDTYTFTYDTSKIGKDGYVVLNGGENQDDLKAAAMKLTAAARNNGTYTVGYDENDAGKGFRITITEKEGQTNFDLTTMEGIERSLGFKIASTNPTDSSKGLTLQIGDTAESYNQLKVNIKDCHTKALGLENISIANQGDAADAVNAIKSAINYVSDVRGTLGATQNRLDHTINNLSVMTENIQDAESTVRDVDIAEEMMAYTKNNILIQSAQAMLAQANQVPQGVLQLLQ